MKCKICGCEKYKVFSALVLNKYLADYQCCKHCGYLSVQNPHWLAEVYSSTIDATDTGLVQRNILLASKVSSLLYNIFSERGSGRYVDVAGGYGLFVRLMRDFGFDFFWNDEYCQNILAKGFSYDAALGPCRAVTAMEVMEHLVDPLDFVDSSLLSTGADTFIFSTELYAGNPPQPEDWWYYTFLTGQHIGFFSRHTLEVIGQRLGLYFASANGLHVLSRRPISHGCLSLATNSYILKINSFWIRRRMKSLTFNDHHKMMQDLR